MVRAYSNLLANADLFGFCRVLFLWTGSIYKLIYCETIVYFLLYYAYWTLITYGLDEEIRDRLIGVLHPVSEAITSIPIEFLLGFYVNHVTNRWWDQYLSLPWIDRVADLVNVTVLVKPPHAEEMKIIRRKIIRYLKLGEAWLYRDMVASFEKKMRTEEDILRIGLATKEEIAKLSNPDIHHSMYWLPFNWATQLVAEANEKKCTFPPTVRDVFRAINDYRKDVELVFKYQTVPVPLCYTQVVTLAVYGYFLCALFTEYHEYFPTVLFVKFIVYFGWLKVAESLICPYGDLDDNDLDMIQHFHRNLQVGYAYVDSDFNAPPKASNENDRDEYPSGTFDDSHHVTHHDSSEEGVHPTISPDLMSQPLQTFGKPPSQFNVPLVCHLFLGEEATAARLKKKHRKEVLQERASPTITQKAGDWFQNRHLYLLDGGYAVDNKQAEHIRNTRDLKTDTDFNPHYKTNNTQL